MSSLPPLSDVIRAYGLAANKALGQHFILNEHLLDKIAKSTGPLQGQTVVEVGPGPGGLTRSLLALNPQTLFSIEKDTRFLEPLNALKNYFQTPFTLLHDDALKVNIFDLGTGPISVIANLPYNIATPLILNWLTAQNPRLSHIAVLIQKEVALRLCAQPKTGAYGRLSVITQLLANVSIAFDVPPGAFSPPPKVDSSVVIITPKTIKIDINTLKKIEKITEYAFGQRRKMIRSSLKSLGEPFLKAAEDLRITLTQRAEELSPQTYFDLAQKLLD